MLRKNRKKIKNIVLTIIPVAIIIIIYFIQFTSLGYRITVPFRDFIEADDGVFIHRNYANSVEEAVSIIDEARRRIKNYFGEVKSAPMIIICDDKNTISKLGGDHDTSTAVFFRAYSYIVLSSDYLNVDIAAPEMTHAEVHSRIFKGKLSNKPLIPIWFDEGVALQNDYRENYNETAWDKVTNNGEEVIDLSTIETPDKFYAGNIEDRRFNFILSRHEISEWVEINGKEALIVLFDEINQGKLFNDLYFTK